MNIELGWKEFKKVILRDSLDLVSYEDASLIRMTAQDGQLTYTSEINKLNVLEALDALDFARVKRERASSEILAAAAAEAEAAKELS